MKLVKQSKSLQDALGWGPTAMEPWAFVLLVCFLSTPKG